MSFFDQILSGLFPSEQNKGPLLHELLSRSGTFKRNYSDWVTEEKTFILGKIWKGYGYKIAKLGSTELSIHLLKSTHSNGFAVIFDPLLSSKSEFQFIMEYFKDLLLELGYKTVNADRRIIEKDKYLESTERYFLKPIPTQKQAPFAQKYGNVTIEHILNNDVSSHLKITVNTYSDRNYKTPLPHSDLFEYLLNGQ